MSAAWAIPCFTTRRTSSAEPQKHAVASPFLHIIEQHAEEVAFLWLLYSQELEAPNPDPGQLAQLKKRINAHVKGLIQARDDGWNCCAKALEAHPESGEVFAASVLALSSSNKGRLEIVQQTIKAVPETANGMVAAQGWQLI